MNGLLLQIFIFLVAAAIIVPVAKKWGLGSVLGYLIAGIIIGPFGLSLFGNVEDVMHITEFGVVMMLFLVGLELKPSKLWELRTPIIGMGGLQVLLTMLVASSIALFFLPWQQAVAVGATLSLSSTAIILQNLREKNLMNTSPGQSVFSVLLFQDIAVIPMLALFPLLTTMSVHADSHAENVLFDISVLSGSTQMLVTLLAVLSILVFGRYVVRPLFRGVVKTEIRELFIGTALAVVIGVSLLMSAVSLSPALGAFLAGVILADSEYRHELESDIEPFKGLLLGVFFISIGASMDFILLGQNLSTILLITTGLIVLKGLILYIVGLIFRMPKVNRVLFAVSLAGGGEFAFVLFRFSVSHGILDAITSDIMISAVAISMFLNPILFTLYEKLRKSKNENKENEFEYDRIDENGSRVIIAGFKRLGLDVGRVLISTGIKPVVIDNDIDMVELLRERNYEVYYGDVTRLDLLESAGAANADLLIISISDREVSSRLVEIVKKHYPHLKIVANAYDHFLAYELLNLGVEKVRLETFGTAMQMGQDALELLGMNPYQAYRMTRVFKNNDEKARPELYKHYMEDEERGITMMNLHNNNMAERLARELNNNNFDVEETWNEKNVGK